MCNKIAEKLKDIVKKLRKKLVRNLPKIETEKWSKNGENFGKSGKTRRKNDEN